MYVKCMWFFSSPTTDAEQMILTMETAVSVACWEQGTEMAEPMGLAGRRGFAAGTAGLLSAQTGVGLVVAATIAEETTAQEP